ncbi:sulfotransferase [Novosphingobium sp. FKTRR1]|uniref:tetratricopeptide repeat-containing sulfotransferase family protein n=1 Tax=Novosphingobium sp. FKTRR1 TaxID=2879118 RepID=UPI001CF0198B|nr:sulfotransferase [Novosphingobium sp. FKTRR1]
MTQDLAQAAALAAAAARAGRATVDDWNTLGWAHAVSGDADGAGRMFQQALALAPRDPEALTGLAGLLRAAGQLRDAALHCDAAIAARPTYPEAWLERAYVMAAGGAMEEARACYTRVVALVPGHAAAHAGLAAIAARDGDGAAVRQQASAALASEPGNAIALAALATVELEGGNAAAARALIEPATLGLPTPSPERMQLLHLLGDACARTGDAAAAHAAYAHANQDFATINAALFAGREPHADFVSRVAAQIGALNPAQWAPPTDPSPASRHVFVLGYPRSGNTLLENILASLPNTQALEEHPTLREADLAFLAEPGGLGALDQLDADRLAELRHAYWERVRAAGIAPEGRVFVDMDPLKSIRLPLIARLFPEARVLLVRRDPRDVVWSCFRTGFALTNAAMDFTTLPGTARHYAATMRLVAAACAQLPLMLDEVHYHRLVQDFDATTQAICAFLDVPWTEDLRRFDRTARARGVSTASARQVRQGLYDGTRQWQPFAPWLEPVLPVLQPWIEALGYEA